MLAAVNYRQTKASWPGTFHLRVCLKMWRQASLPAVEDGSLPSGKNMDEENGLAARHALPLQRRRRAGSPALRHARRGRTLARSWRPWMRAKASRLADSLRFGIWGTTNGSQRIGGAFVHRPVQGTFDLSQPGRMVGWKPVSLGCVGGLGSLTWQRIC